MKQVLAVIVVFVLLAGGALLFAWSGIYNIAATRPHWDVTLWLIEMVRDRSIEVRSDDIAAPEKPGPESVRAAFSHYHEMCRLCHGAPDFSRNEFAKGLYPAPPHLTSGHVQGALGRAELYWIIKHGLKLTGMPAFGPTHTDREIWGLVTLVEQIPEMSPEQYRKRIRTSKSGGETEGGHTHSGSE